MLTLSMYLVHIYQLPMLHALALISRLRSRICGSVCTFDSAALTSGSLLISPYPGVMALRKSLCWYRLYWEGVHQ